MIVLIVSALHRNVSIRSAHDCKIMECVAPVGYANLDDWMTNGAV